MRTIVSKVFIVSSASLVAAFLVILLLSDMNHALFMSPLIAFSAGVTVFLGTFERYERNRLNADRPIEKVEIDRWVAKSLLVSVPVFVLCVTALTGMVSSGEIPSLFQSNFLIFAFVSFFAVVLSVARCITPLSQNLAKEASQLSAVRSFKNWLDVKA